jgi:hypothetical protein
LSGVFLHNLLGDRSKKSTAGWGYTTERSFSESVITKTNGPDYLYRLEQICFATVIWTNQNIEVAEVQHAVNEVLIAINPDLL